MLRYLQSWIDQLRWQCLPAFQKLAQMLLDHLDGILNYCRTKVPTRSGRGRQRQSRGAFTTRSRVQ